MKRTQKMLALLLAMMLTMLSVTVSLAETSGPIVVTDMAGRTVTLDAPARTVHVDWASGITLAMTLGATDRLVAVPTAFHQDTFAWCRIICPKLNDIPADDAIYENIEGVLNYAPQLVVTNNRDNIERYELMGLTVIYVKFNDSESFKQSMLIVGQALGDETYAAAQSYCTYMDEMNAMVLARTSSLSDADRPSVYYVDSRFMDCYHTVGTGEIQEVWINIAGCKLATAPDYKGRNLEITAEAFLVIDPDVILIGAQNQAAVKEMLLDDPILAELSAVKANSIIRIPQGMFPWCRTGPESAMQALWAAATLHPDLFEDVNLMDVARDFYQRFYGTTLSDEHLQGILNGQLTPDAE